MKLLPLAVNSPSQSLEPQVDLSQPAPFRAIFPILLDGDQLVTSPEHLGVGYLVSVLRNAGVECRMIEVPAGGADDAIMDEIAAWQPDLVGITLTTVSAAHATEFGTKLRSKTSAFLLAGGPLASYRGAELMDLPGWEFLDGLIRGEGELPILRLVEALRTKNGLQQVPSLAHRVDGRVIQNSLVAAIHNLDDIPFPARDQFELHGGKPSPRFKYLRLSTSRGCTSFCTFCNAPHARNRIAPGPVWRGCSPTRIADEIEQLYKRYGCRSYAFVDSTFEDPGGTSRAKARLRAIAEELLDRKLPVYFGVCMQARNWKQEDQDLLELLWRAGLEYVLVGIEAGTDRDLKLWRKRSNVADNERIIGMLRDTSVYVQFGFISYHPYTTFETLKESYAFLRRSGVAHNFKKFLDRLELYPGAEIVDTLREDGLLLPSYDERCDEFGYVFQDERILHLVESLHRLFGTNYQQHYAVPQALYKFEGDDSALHIFISRLARMYRDEPVAAEILDRGHQGMEQIRQQLAEYNVQLISEFVDRAERNQLDPAEVAAASPKLADFVLARVQELRAVQMRTAVEMRRARYDLMAAGIESLA